MNFSTFLPTLNASLNFAAFLCLLGGLWAIKKKKKDERLHRFSMISAFSISCLFLISYIYYHAHFGSKSFPELGWVKTVYLFILVPHVILAVIMLPLILKTFYHASQQEWTKHKRVARITLPVWLYVSFSGVVVYLMLYRFFIQTT